MQGLQDYGGFPPRWATTTGCGTDSHPSPGAGSRPSPGREGARPLTGGRAARGPAATASSDSEVLKETPAAPPAPSSAHRLGAPDRPPGAAPHTGKDQSRAAGGAENEAELPRPENPARPPLTNGRARPGPRSDGPRRMSIPGVVVLRPEPSPSPAVGTAESPESQTTFPRRRGGGAVRPMGMHDRAWAGNGAFRAWEQ